MTAEEAYNKTEETLGAYKELSLFGGDPFCFIEKYARQEVREAIRELYNEIQHGDGEHQKWLKNKMNNFLRRKWKNTTH